MTMALSFVFTVFTHLSLTSPVLFSSTLTLVNKLSDNGLIPIAKALRKNKILKTLNLGLSCKAVLLILGCDITNHGVATLSDFIFNNRVIKRLQLNVSSKEPLLISRKQDRSDRADESGWSAYEKQRHPVA